MFNYQTEMSLDGSLGGQTVYYYQPPQIWNPNDISENVKTFYGKILMKDKDSIPFCDQLRWGIRLDMASPTLLKPFASIYA